MALRGSQFDGLRKLDEEDPKKFWDNINSGLSPISYVPSKRTELIQPNTSELVEPNTSDLVQPNTKDYIFNKQRHPELKPELLMQPHFKVEDMSLETICMTIQSELEKCKNLAFTSTTYGLSWYGSVLHASNYCEFRFTIYRVKDRADLFYIKGKKDDGDVFMFGDLYDAIKKSFTPKMCRTTIVESHEPKKSTLSVNDRQMFRNWIQFAREAMQSSDYRESLNGIQFVGQFAIDPEINEDIFLLGVIEDLVNVLYQWDKQFILGANNWKVQHSLYILAFLSDKYNENFNTYINSMIVDGELLSTRLQRELDIIIREISEPISAEKIHCTKSINILKEKIRESPMEIDIDT